MRNISLFKIGRSTFPATQATTPQATRQHSQRAICFTRLKAMLQPWLQLLSSLAFIHDLPLGCAILLAFACFPTVGLGAVGGILGALGIRILLQIKTPLTLEQPALTNALLSGALAAFLVLGGSAWPLVAIALGAVTALVTMMLSAYWGATPSYSLPFSLGFVLLGIPLYQIVPSASQAVNSLTAVELPVLDLPAVELSVRQCIVYACESISLLTLTPHWAIGALYFGLLARRSWLLTLAALCAIALGTLTLQCIHQDTTTLPSLLAGLNFALTGMLIAAVAGTPSKRSCLLAALGVILCAIVFAALENWLGANSWFALSAPFALISIALTQTRRQHFTESTTLDLNLSPEQRASSEHTDCRRFPAEYCGIQPATLGAWTISQGIDGPYTHQGAWSFAFDFVLKNNKQRAYRNAGNNPTDYYAFGKPIVAPVSGTITQVIQHHPDQAIGSVDRENNWGNLIIIYDPRGFYVKLCHLQQHSAKVAVGETVIAGQHLATCGNSGYSPEPHLHLQVQAEDRVGAPTIPFHFIHAAVNHQLVRHALPVTHDVLEYRPPAPDNLAASSYMLGQRLSFSTDASETPQYIEIVLLPDGSFGFQHQDETLPFFTRDAVFYTYGNHCRTPLLRAIAQALPSLPLFAQPTDSWSDHSTLAHTANAWQALRAIFDPTQTSAETQSSIDDNLRVRTQDKKQHNYQIQLSPQHGILSIETPTQTWTRRYD